MELSSYELQKILFLDIETVPQSEDYASLNDDDRLLWDKKAKFLVKNEDDQPEVIYNRAGIYSEFGKIICISVGNIHFLKGKTSLRLKSFYGDDEMEILRGFKKLLDSFGKRKNLYLAAHNGKEFDFPYIARRMLINRIALPALLQMAGKKPWEVPHIDTLELWKFGDYKHYTSLELLTHIFNIPSPKDDIDGSMVAKIYYEGGNLERIVKYCEKDVIAVAQVFLCFRGEGLIDEGNITSVTFASDKVE
jgi:3'-5' exonuclease